MASRLQERFFDHGLRILSEHGHSGLKIIPLCQSVKVTTGAFYHSFEGWRDFIDQLLEHWRVERTTRLVEAAEQNQDPVQRLETLAVMTTSLPHKAEAAIRAWSLSDPEVAKVQHRVDQDRYNVIYPAFLSLVGDEELAHRYSRTGMYLLIGFEQAESLQDVETLAWSLEQVKTAATTHR